jgi:hypothetical protein
MVRVEDSHTSYAASHALHGLSTPVADGELV